MGRYDESLNGFDEVKKLDFDDYSTVKTYHSYYAKSLDNMGRLDDALKVYDDFLEKYPFDEYMKKYKDELFDKINQ